MQDTVEFWLVSFESEGVRKLYGKPLNASSARNVARNLSMAGMRARARRFVIKQSDIWAIIDGEKRRLIAT